METIIENLSKIENKSLRLSTKTLKKQLGEQFEELKEFYFSLTHPQRKQKDKKQQNHIIIAKWNISSILESFPQIYEYVKQAIEQRIASHPYKQKTEEERLAYNAKMNEYMKKYYQHNKDYRLRQNVINQRGKKQYLELAKIIDKEERKDLIFQLYQNSDAEYEDADSFDCGSPVFFKI